MLLLQHSRPGLKVGYLPAQESHDALLTVRHGVRRPFCAYGFHLTSAGFRHCIIAAVTAVSTLCSAPLFAETPSHQGHNHETAKPAPSRLIKPGTVLPPRMAPVAALQPKARVELINASDDLPEPPKSTTASAPLPDPVAPRASLQPQAVFKPFAIAR